jgi:hypothetical protein
VPPGAADAGFHSAENMVSGSTSTSMNVETFPVSAGMERSLSLTPPSGRPGPTTKRYVAGPTVLVPLNRMISPGEYTRSPPAPSVTAGPPESVAREGTITSATSTRMPIIRFILKTTLL